MQTATESFVILSRIKRQHTKRRPLFMKHKKGLSETLPGLLQFLLERLRGGCECGSPAKTLTSSCKRAVKTICFVWWHATRSPGMNCNRVYDHYECMKPCIYPGCRMSYASSDTNYKHRMIKTNTSQAHIGSSGDELQKVQEWQLSQ